MVRPNDDEIASLLAVAREIRDTFEESGYSVDSALSQHDAFTDSAAPGSMLERALVLHAARRGGPQSGFALDEVSGGLDLVAYSDSMLRRYRVKRVRLTAAGEYEVICGSQSSLLTMDPESLIREEKWILGYISSDDHTIDQVIAAEIVDWRGTGGGPVHLVFGTVIDLSDNRPPRGFVSTDEDLEGFAEDEGTAEAG